MTKDEYAKMTDEEALKILETEYPDEKWVWEQMLKNGGKPKDVLIVTMM